MLRYRDLFCMGAAFMVLEDQDRGPVRAPVRHHSGSSTRWSSRASCHGADRDRGRAERSHRAARPRCSLSCSAARCSPRWCLPAALASPLSPLPRSAPRPLSRSFRSSLREPDHLPNVSATARIRPRVRANLLGAMVGGCLSSSGANTVRPSRAATDPGWRTSTSARVPDQTARGPLPAAVVSGQRAGIGRRVAGPAPQGSLWPREISWASWPAGDLGVLLGSKAVTRS